MKAGLVEASSLRVRAKAVDKAVIEYPRPGWAEQDPEKLWDQVSRLSQRLLEENKGLRPVIALGFSAHMAGTVFLDRAGRPLRNAIIWLDERAAGLPKELFQGFPRIAGYNALRLYEFLRVTGGAPGKTGKDPLSKIVWVRENEPDVYNSTWRVVGVTGYLVYRATGRALASPDEASLTWLADTRKLPPSWSKKLVEKYGIRADILPEIVEAHRVAGRLLPKAASELGLEGDIPVITGSGDVAAAAIGSGAVGEGELHVYIGTSDWVAGHSTKRLVDVTRYVGSIASGLPGKYLVVAEQETAGAVLDWAMELLGLGEEYGRLEELVSTTPPGARGLIFAPWFFGERCPVDDPRARGALVGLTSIHGRGDVLRAVMEGVALNIRWAFDAITGLVKPVASLRAIGGGCSSDTWCEILASALGVRVDRVAEPENAVLRGVAALALAGTGRAAGVEEAARRVRVSKSFTPQPGLREKYSRLYKVFKQFYHSVRKVYAELHSLAESG